MTGQKSDFVKDLLVPVKSMKTTVILVIACSAIVSACQAILIFIFGPLFKALFQSNASETIDVQNLFPDIILAYLPKQSWDLATFFVSLPIVLLVLGLVRGLALYLLNIYQEKISLEVAHHIRRQSFQKILLSDYLDISKKGAGQWMSQIMNDIMILQQRFTDLAKSLIKDGLTIVGAFFALALINASMTFGIIAVCVPGMLLLGIGSKKIAYYTEVIQSRIGGLSALVSNHYSRMGDIYVHQAQDIEKSFFEQENSELFKFQKKSIALRSAFAPSVELLGFLVFSVVLFLYANGQLSENFNSSYLMQFVIALGICIRPLRNLGEQVSKLQETRGSMRSNLDIVEKRNADIQTYSKIVLPINIDSFDVGYGNKSLVSVKNLKLNPGRCTLLRGESGSGKSTVIKSLAGLIAPTNWSSTSSWESIKSSAAYVSQVPFLFDGSLSENIFYGLDGSNDTDSAIEISKELGLEDILKNKKDFSATFSSYESELSGGQKQRLTILRALLSEKPILLLDEATSALDVDTERKVIHFLIKWTQRNDAHLIFISHRDHSEDEFDQCFKIENGKWIPA